MKAIARRSGPMGYTHEVEIRQHRLTADEPTNHEGADQGATPQELLAASLAACTAITMEMYAKRKGWEVGSVEVECEYAQPDHPGAPTEFQLVLRLPDSLEDEQRERLATIAARCPVHRTLTGETRFTERVEVVPAGQSST